MLLTEGVGESLDLSSFHRDGVRLFLLYCSQKSSVDDDEAEDDNTEASDDVEESEERVEEKDWSMKAEDDTVKVVEESDGDNDRSIAKLWSY